MAIRAVSYSEQPDPDVLGYKCVYINVIILGIDYSLLNMSAKNKIIL